MGQWPFECNPVGALRPFGVNLAMPRTGRNMSNEADTCRKLVVPKLQAAGWDNEPSSIAEQRTITDGRIVPRGQGFLHCSPGGRTEIPVFAAESTHAASELG